MPEGDAAHRELKPSTFLLYFARTDENEIRESLRARIITNLVYDGESQSRWRVPEQMESPRAEERAEKEDEE